MTTPNTPDASGRSRVDRKSPRLLIAALLAGLAMVGCETSDDTGTVLTASLNGATADIMINTDFSKICWDVQGFANWADGDMRMQVRSGVAGEVGPVVVEFLSGNVACTDLVPSSVLKEISESPGNFYVDVRSPRHPDEAVRGQLEEGSR